ncbi:MAG: SPOR domain-containing protein [Gammaproteobacteria bacterium]|nr:SPOR domain-containing protein [Gammaproteobacteria bacterium]
MAASINVDRCMFRHLAGVLLVLVATVASANPSLIAGSRVTGDESSAEIEIRFNCKVAYQQHEPEQRGDRLRIYLDPTGICNGVSPLVAESRGRFRPAKADSAHLIDFEYDGDSAAGPVLTLNFSGPVAYTIDTQSISFQLVVHVRPEAAQAAASDKDQTVLHRQVVRPQEEAPDFVINLVSFRRVPTIADVPNLQLAAEQRIFYSEVDVDGTSWYRLKLGDFKSADTARIALSELKTKFPGAWIDQVDEDSVAVDLTVAAKEVFADQDFQTEDEVPGEPLAEAVTSPSSPDAGEGSKQSKVDTLMDEARQTMVSGDRSRAIQIYTKILQMPEDPRQPEAQEYLALAREKNGQIAHAKAEYQRYLSLYPEGDGAVRVSQRLAALLTINQQSNAPIEASGTVSRTRRRNQSDWRMQTFFSQFYRRDANQLNDQNEIVSQSALYSDINFDARRRGERFDFSSRVSVGYRNDFLGNDVGSGNDSRVSYAYADLADAKTGLRGRIGRQSRNTGGVLGRFDGLNLGYQANERLLVNAVVGKPAYSANDGIDSARTFYGTSVNYGPLLDGLEFGVFFIQQDIDGIDDRQAVGGEFRYFGTNQSIWGLIEYDTLYNELGSAFLQASWRFGSRLSLHGSVDRRHSPFLSAGNAIIGQPVADFSELTRIFSEDEIRQLGLDRSPTSTSYSIGVSHSLTPKLQINADANQTSIEATPASGGVFGTPEASYRYFSTTVVASSLVKEGDVSIVGVRYSDSDTTKVISLTLDSRVPFGRTWRINPRLRVDRRERLGDQDYEWIYTPGIRIQYRRSQKLRVELEAGKQFAQREMNNLDIDRESYFLSFGYQAFF